MKKLLMIKRKLPIKIIKTIIKDLLVKVLRKVNKHNKIIMMTNTQGNGKTMIIMAQKLKMNNKYNIHRNNLKNCKRSLINLIKIVSNLINNQHLLKKNTDIYFQPIGFNATKRLFTSKIPILLMNYIQKLLMKIFYQKRNKLRVMFNISRKMI